MLPKVSIMGNKKIGVLLLCAVLFLTMASFVQAATLSETLGKAVSAILDVGSLKFLLGSDAENRLVGFLRIAIGILVFSLIYMGLSMIPNMPGNIRTTIGILLAIITSVFMPKDLLLLFGGTYSTIFAFLIIGAPIAGSLWLVIGTPTPSRPVAVIKFFTVLFLIYLINEISHWAQKIGGIIP